MIFEGRNASEIEAHFQGLSEDILQRDRQRVERFFGGELRDIIASGLDKYRDRAPSVGFEVIGEPARVASTAVDWSDYVFVQQETASCGYLRGGLSTVPAFNAAMQGANRRVPTANGKTKEVSALAYLMDYKKVPPVFYRMYMPSIGKFFEMEGEPASIHISLSWCPRPMRGGCSAERGGRLRRIIWGSLMTPRMAS